MNRLDAKKYETYPEGSGGKKTYDMFYLTFQEYLNKYYKNPDLSRWDYINQKFIIPLFDGTTWEDYWVFLHQVRPKFTPNENKKNEFWNLVKDDVRFSIEIKQFFTFLYSVDFFRDFTFEQWLNAKNWMHPWYEDENSTVKSITELLNFNYSENYLKSLLSGLNIF